jgi:thioredoxin 2
VVQRVARALAGTAAVVTVNTQENPRLAGRFSIRGIPALLILRRGNVIDRSSGTMEYQRVLDWWKRHNV